MIFFVLFTNDPWCQQVTGTNDAHIPQNMFYYSTLYSDHIISQKYIAHQSIRINFTNIGVKKAREQEKHSRRRKGESPVRAYFGLHFEVHLMNDF